MKEIYYTPEEEKIIKEIRPYNTIDELKLLLSIKSRNVQNALWYIHRLNKDFIELWVNTIKEEDIDKEQSKIKHVIFYPAYSFSPSKMRMQCVDVIHDIAKTIEYKIFIELKQNERVIPRDKWGNRDKKNRIHFEVYDRWGGFHPPYDPYETYAYGGPIPPFRNFIIREDDYKRLWTINHMSIIEIDVYLKEENHYFTSQARVKAINLLNSTEALKSLLNDQDLSVRSAANKKLDGERLDVLQELSNSFMQNTDYTIMEKSRETQEQNRLQEQQLQEMLQGSTLFFDTETTGVPRNYKAPISDSSNWPRLVQLAWLMADKNGNVLKHKSVIIKPDGFSIPSDASAVHGITTERALREGLPLSDVLEEFITDLSFAEQVVGHNIDFDQHIVGSELYRLSMDYNALMDKPCTCTMKSSTDFCAIPNPNSYFGGYKWPSLQELYRKLFNRDFTDAHDALADITATKDCFFELKQRGII